MPEAIWLIQILGMTGHREDGNIAGVRRLPQRAAEFEPVHARHGEIRHHRARPKRQSFFECLKTVGARRQAEARMTEGSR